MDEIVARSFIQCIDALRVAIFDPPVSEADLVRHMHTVKESLLVADDLAREVSRKVDECISEYRALGELKSSMSVFPHVHDLDQMEGRQGFVRNTAESVLSF